MILKFFNFFITKKNNLFFGFSRKIFFILFFFSFKLIQEIVFFLIFINLIGTTCRVKNYS